MINASPSVPAVALESLPSGLTSRTASAIPGATIARLVFLDIAIDWNEFIIPQTVPNRPIKGAVDPIVA